MNRHLISIEISVKCRANEGMELDGLPFDQDWLKGLNAQAMQGGSPVKQNRMFADDLIQNIPNLGFFFFHHFLCALDGGYEALNFQPVVNKRFKKL